MVYPIREDQLVEARIRNPKQETITMASDPLRQTAQNPEIRKRIRESEREEEETDMR